MAHPKGFLEEARKKKRRPKDGCFLSKSTTAPRAYVTYINSGQDREGTEGTERRIVDWTQHTGCDPAVFSTDTFFPSRSA